MSFFFLNFTCTIQRPTAVRQESGQSLREYSTVEDRVPCLWLEVSGNVSSAPQEGFQSVVSLYLDPDSTLVEGDRVIDIRSATGDVIEAGPYMVESVKRVGSPFTGTTHHISAKLRGEA